MTDTTKSYLCIPGWGPSGVEIGDLVGGDGVDSVENASGITDSMLGNYTTINTESSVTAVDFNTSLAMAQNDSAFDGLVTVALLGVSLPDLNEDTVLRATMTVGSETYESAASVYGQVVNRLVGSESLGHALLGGGIASLIFHDLPVSVLASGVEFTLQRDDGGTLGSMRIRIGSVWLGLQVVINSDPQSFAWTNEARNDQFESRGGGTFSSDGVLRPGINFEIHRLSLETITGIGPDFYEGNPPKPSLYRAMISSIGEYCLLSPFPYAASDWSNSPDPSEVTQRLKSVGQNFMAVGGLLERRQDVTMTEWREAIDSVYKMRLRFVGSR